MDWTKIKGLNEERAKVKADLEAILAKGEAEKRDLSAEEAGKFDELDKRAKSLSTQIDRLNAVGALDAAVRSQANPGRGPLDDPNKPDGEKREIGGFDVKSLKRYSLLRALNALSTPGGKLDGVEKEISDELATRSRALGGSGPKGFYFPTELPTGPDFAPSPERRTTGLVDIGTTGAGAVATILDTSNFIEALRNRLVLSAAGTTVISGLVGNLAIPKQTGVSQAYWVSDATAPNTSNPAVTGQVSFSPKTVGTYTDISRKFLLQSSLSAEGFVRNDLVKVLGLAIDLAGFNGTGSGQQPTGILQNSTVSGLATAVGTNGGTPTWANIVAMETAVAAANADYGTMSFVTNAKVRGLLKGTLRSSVAGAKYIWDDDQTVNSYRTFVTNAIPSNLTKGSGTGLSAAIFGNFADLIIGTWGQLDILVDPYTGGNAGTLRINALQDVDIQLRRTESFNVMVDIAA